MKKIPFGRKGKGKVTLIAITKDKNGHQCVDVKIEEWDGTDWSQRLYPGDAVSTK